MYNLQYPFLLSNHNSSCIRASKRRRGANIIQFAISFFIFFNHYLFIMHTCIQQQVDVIRMEAELYEGKLKKAEMVPSRIYVLLVLRALVPLTCT